jgi:hypothetical protein
VSWFGIIDRFDGVKYPEAASGDDQRRDPLRLDAKMLKLIYSGADAKSVLDGLLRSTVTVLEGVQEAGTLKDAASVWSWDPRRVGGPIPRRCRICLGGLSLDVEGLRIDAGELHVQTVVMVADPAGLVVDVPTEGQPDVRLGKLRLGGGVELHAKILAVRGCALWIRVRRTPFLESGTKVELIPGLPTDRHSLRQVATRRPTVPTAVSAIPMVVQEVKGNRALIQPLGPAPGFTELLWMLHNLTMVRFNDAPAVLKNLDKGLFLALPKGAAARNSAHQVHFVATQKALVAAHQGATLLAAEGEQEYAISLSLVLPGRIQLHALSSRKEKSRDEVARAAARRVRAQLFLALGLELAGRPKHWMIGFANKGERFVDLFVGLPARGLAPGQPPPVCFNVIFHKIDLKAVDAYPLQEKIEDATSPPGWLVAYLRGPQSGEGGRLACALDLDKPHDPHALTSRRYFCTSDSVLVIEQSPLGVSPLGIADRAHFWLKDPAASTPEERGLRLETLLKQPAVNQWVKAKGRELLAWFEPETDRTWLPGGICLNGVDEEVSSTFAFAMEPDRLALWMSWIRAITLADPLPQAA